MSASSRRRRRRRVGYEKRRVAAGLHKAGLRSAGAAHGVVTRLARDEDELATEGAGSPAFSAQWPMKGAEMRARLGRLVAGLAPGAGKSALLHSSTEASLRMGDGK